MLTHKQRPALSRLPWRLAGVYLLLLRVGECARDWKSSASSPRPPALTTTQPLVSRTPTPTPTLPPVKGSGSLKTPDHSMAELVVPLGYPLEQHLVETQDGYILGLFRIPYGLTARGRQPAKGDPTKPVVFLQHGLLECSASWVVTGPNTSLAFILADAGYDVWMGNSRGNSFSRRHSNLSPYSNEFWEFSFDEMAAYDLPASFTYVLAVGGQQRLSYVGHSQGTTIGFAMLASQAAYAAKVNLAIMMAPVTFLGHITSLPVLALAGMNTDEVFAAIGADEFLPSTKTMVDAFGLLCHTAPWTCADAIGSICGYNAANINMTRLPIYLSYTPAGTSVENMVHWAQGVRQQLVSHPRFLKYDYGAACATPFGFPRKCNSAKYGQDTPPVYELHNIQTPLALFSGGRDKLSDPTDVGELKKQLQSGVVVYAHEEPSYEHLDFTWGSSAARLIYPTVMRLLEQHA